MKAYRLTFLFAALLLHIYDIQAQSITERVITLNEAVVDTTIGSKMPQPVGQKHSTMGRMTLQSGRSRDLGEVLATNSSIYIKSIGRGALATASIRGTSSNHTQVLWNGMPINSSMVGSFDFSTIPAFFLDRVTLSFGAADSRGVSGVLGGTIRLESISAPQGLEAIAEYGSNNTQTYGLSTGYRLGKLTLSTRGWWQSSDNDFKFLNKVLSKEPFYARRTDGQYKQGSLMQQFATRTGATDIKADFWVMWGDRSLPQPIVVSHTSSESQKDLSVRSTLSASRLVRGGGLLDIRTSWLHENLRYRREMGGEGDQYNKNIINTFLINGNYTKQLGQRFSYELMIQGRADITDAQDLNAENIDRYTISGGTNIQWRPLENLKVGASAKLATFDQLLMPTGSVGAEWEFVRGLTLSTNVAYNYHAPTLNDLYWQPGGNPELEPEHGISQDITLRWSIPTSVARFTLTASRFRMDIDDWIIWIPTDRYYWSPQNMNQVRSKGFEVSLESLFHIGNLSNRLVFNYCNTDAHNRQASFDGDASVGKQLPYVPRNKWNVNLTSQYRTLIFNYYCGYTGKRYTTTDQSYSTNDYNLHSASVEWSIKSLTLRFSVDNLFDTYWESTQYYPQPLKTFNFKIAYKINNW